MSDQTDRRRKLELLLDEALGDLVFSLGSAIPDVLHEMDMRFDVLHCLYIFAQAVRPCLREPDSRFSRRVINIIRANGKLFEDIQAEAHRFQRECIDKLCAEIRSERGD